VSNADAAAMKALLDAVVGPPELVVYDGKVPKGVTGPYVLIYFDDSDPELADSRPLTGASQRHITRAITHSVGVTAEAARMVADMVRAAWLDVRPTVAGRTCQPIRREDGQPPQRDEETLEAVYDKVDVYRLESVPA
jgi:hypothetical protein